jgi:hypothetical protein
VPVRIIRTATYHLRYYDYIPERRDPTFRAGCEGLRAPLDTSNPIGGDATRSDLVILDFNMKVMITTHKLPGPSGETEVTPRQHRKLTPPSTFARSSEPRRRASLTTTTSTTPTPHRSTITFTATPLATQLQLRWPTRKLTIATATTMYVTTMTITARIT